MSSRARTGPQKEERAGAIRDAARSLFSAREFGDVSVQEIAERAGVAKGTVFLYYATKETLGLVVLEELLVRWWDDLEDRLSVVAGSGSPSAVAAAVRRSLENRGELLRLLAMVSSVLEANADDEILLSFRTRLMEGATRIGAAMENALGFLREGDGVEAALALHAIAIGVQQLASVRLPRGRGRDLEAFRVDVAGAIGRTMRVQLEGARAVAALGAATA